MKQSKSTVPIQDQAIQIWQDADKLAEVKKIYGKDLNDAEFQILQQIGKSTNLNPFLRELWAVKYGSSPAQIFIGRDGYRKAAQNNPDYDYHLVDAVCANDEFTIDNGEVKHKYSVQDRGALIGAYCTVKRRSSSKAMFNFADLKEYTTKKSLWESKPATMIKKVAEAQGLRMAFQQLFAGTYDESEDWTKKDEAPKEKAEVKVIEQNKFVPVTFVTEKEIEDLLDLFTRYILVKPSDDIGSGEEALMKAIKKQFNLDDPKKMTIHQAKALVDVLTKKLSELEPHDPVASFEEFVEAPPVEEENIIVQEAHTANYQPPINQVGVAQEIFNADPVKIQKVADRPMEDSKTEKQLSNQERVNADLARIKAKRAAIAAGTDRQEIIKD